MNGLYGDFSGVGSYRLIQIPEEKIEECVLLSQSPMILESISQLENATSKATVHIEIGHRGSGDKFECTPLNLAANNSFSELRRLLVRWLLTCGIAVYRLRPASTNFRAPMVLGLGLEFETRMVSDYLKDVFRLENPEMQGENFADNADTVDEENQLPDWLRTSQLLQLSNFTQFLQLLKRNDPKAQLQFANKKDSPLEIKEAATGKRLRELKPERAKILKHCQRAMEADTLPFVVDMMDLQASVRLYAIVDRDHHIIDIIAWPKSNSGMPRFNARTGECEYGNMRVIFTREYIKIKNSTDVVIQTPVMLSAEHLRTLDSIKNAIIMTVNDETNHRFALARKDQAAHRMTEPLTNNMQPDMDLTNPVAARADEQLDENLAEMENVMIQLQRSQEIDRVMKERLQSKGYREINFGDPGKPTPRSSSSKNPLVLPPNYELTALPKMSIPEIVWKEHEACQENIHKNFGIENIANKATLKNSSVEQLMAVSELNNFKRSEQLIELVKKFFLYLTFDMFVLDIIQDCLHALSVRQKQILARIRRVQLKRLKEMEKDNQAMLSSDSGSVDSSADPIKKRLAENERLISALSNGGILGNSDANIAQMVDDKRYPSLDVVGSTGGKEDYQIKISKLLGEVYDTQLTRIREEQKKHEVSISGGLDATGTRPDLADMDVDVEWFRKIFTPQQVRQFTIEYLNKLRIAVVVPLSHPNSYETLMSAYESDILDGDTLQSNLLRSMNINHRQRVRPAMSAKDGHLNKLITEKIVELWVQDSLMSIQNQHQPDLGSGLDNRARVGKRTHGDMEDLEDQKPEDISRKVRQLGKQKAIYEDKDSGRRPKASTKKIENDNVVKDKITKEKATKEAKEKKKSKPAPEITGSKATLGNK